MMLPIYRYGSITLNEARLRAGFSLPHTLELLNISPSTWYRWQQQAPPWAFRLLECYAGHLDHLGWHGWQIQNGRLFTYDLNYRYFWTPADFLIHAHNLSEHATPQIIRAAANESPPADVRPAQTGPSR